MSDYARQVKLIREKSGLSIDKFASKLGVSDQTVRNWEAGKYMPSQENIARLLAFRKGKDE